MCLITDQQEPLTAKRDLIVYKLLEDDLKAPYNRFYYRLGELFETVMQPGDLCPFDDIDSAFINKTFPEGIRKTIGIKSIGKGFHSIKTLARVKKFLKVHSSLDEYVVYKCIIPKGGKYYLGFTSLCVSDKIIISEPLMISDKKVKRSVARKAK